MFTEDIKITQAATIADGASGTSAITGATIDTAGFEGGCVVVQAGPITANGVQSIKLQQSDDSDGDPDGFSDVEGSSQTVADSADNTVFVIDFSRLTKRYAKVIISRATQASTFAAVYYQWGARNKPVTQPAGVNVERFNSPAEGTA